MANLSTRKAAPIEPEKCEPCGATPKTDDKPIARRAITIKVKATVLIPVEGIEGAFEATAQKAVTDALNVGGALVQSVTSKTKAA